MEHLKVKSFGPIEDTEVNFGDLTLIVGPQASGKSIFLQLLKLIVDKNSMIKTLDQYGYVWKENTKNILDIYFGEGMSGLWKPESIVEYDHQSYAPDDLLNHAGDISEHVFYIPAQRILSISDGRPKNFMEFDTTAPYVLRRFSETLRLYLQNSMGNETTIFPVKHQLKGQVQKYFIENIFPSGEVVMDESSSQKKMKLVVEDMSVPFLAWSAGQKEFMPLLMAFYCLAGPPKIVRKNNEYPYVVIEEPEMGLHPQAIQSVILQIADLMAQGYKVIVSTHSPVFLEFAWAFRLLQSKGCNDESLYEMFNLKKTSATEKLFKDLFHKEVYTFYFARKNGKVVSKDISTLDAGSDDSDVAEWGGISSFAGKAADIVSKYYSGED